MKTSQSSERQKQKNINLVSHKNLQPSLLNIKTPSNKDLSQDIISALTKSPNFTVAPKKIPKKEISQPSTVNHLPTPIRTTKFPPPNIIRQERWALQDLNRDTDIIVLPVDKGNTTVAINTSDYKKKKNLFLNKAYKKLDKDPTNTIAQNTKILMERATFSIKLNQH
ncbi:PREDICTED: uncharacterized protein LOC105144997 [Acromyrmex echinatior]|uniref:uncharacterized protein LOC105144997 n=1 Tax=Acromyrmex echinatior TaxID=103372 RepID=UPI000580F45E|nr:PREDICTED: uncharacterized protein LOC105144997 [Acromyrmex echinatior]